MPKLTFRGIDYEAAASQSVLDVLLRHGVEVAHSCKKGICQACLLRAVDGVPPARAQEGLKPTLKAQGYFLACVCDVGQEMTVAEPSASDVYRRAVVVSKELLGGDVCRVRLEPTSSFEYRAGQFVNLRRDDGLVRSYSLASVPHEDRLLELHVRRMNNGRMSNWIFDGLPIGTTVDLYGPSGACFYLPGSEDGDLLLIGGGTGIAPLAGIAREALLSGHRGRLHLFHGSATVGGLYLDRELRALSDRFEQLRYTPCVDGEDPAGAGARGSAPDVAFAEHRSLSGVRIYLCGPPAMVHSAKKRAYLAGASLSNIHADPFEQCDLSREQR